MEDKSNTHSYKEGTDEKQVPEADIDRILDFYTTEARAASFKIEFVRSYCDREIEIYSSIGRVARRIADEFVDSICLFLTRCWFCDNTASLHVVRRKYFDGRKNNCLEGNSEKRILAGNDTSVHGENEDLIAAIELETDRLHDVFRQCWERVNPDKDSRLREIRNGRLAHHDWRSAVADGRISEQKEYLTVQEVIDLAGETVKLIFYFEHLWKRSNKSGSNDSHRKDLEQFWCKLSTNSD